jgi:hypothetical protein
MRAQKWKKVNWAQTMFNNLCNKLERWHKYVKENKGDKKDTCQSTLILAKIFFFLNLAKEQSTKTIDQGQENQTRGDVGNIRE